MPEALVATSAVPLPGGFVWQQRATPDPQRFGRWRRALDQLAMAATNGHGAPHAAAKERIALLAAYDGGWDVRDAAGMPLPSPCRLSLRGWNAVPRDVIEAMLDHLDAQAQEGLAQMQAQAQAQGNGDGHQ